MKDSMDNTETLRKGNLPKPEAVRQAKEEPGVAARCIKAQTTTGETINNDPKVRYESCCGCDE